MVLRSILNALRNKLKLPKNKYATIGLFLVVFIVLGYFLGKEQNANANSVEVIEGMDAETESDCLRSIREFQATAAAQMAEDERRHELALSAWNAAKDSWVTSFQNDRNLWGQCDEGNFECEPVSDFFTLRNTHFESYDIPGKSDMNLNKNQCLRECRKMPSCDMATMVPGKCWLKSFETRKNSDWQVGYKTNTGMVIKDNTYIPGDWYILQNGKPFGGSSFVSPGVRHTADSCKTSCENDPNCDGYSYLKTNNYCYHKKFNTHANAGWETAFKNKKANYEFPDNHPYITTGAPQEKPTLRYRPLPDPGGIVCQECTQEISGNVSVEESQRVDFAQNLECIGQVDQTAPTNGGSGNGGTGNGGSGNGESSQQSPPPSPSPSPSPTPTPDDDEWTNTQIGGIVGGVLFLLIIMAASIMLAVSM